jgi:hypothetical protein
MKTFKLILFPIRWVKKFPIGFMIFQFFPLIYGSMRKLDTVDIGEQDHMVNYYYFLK